MPYDEGLAHRLRETLGSRPGLTEKKMFGGLAFMIHGNMAVGIIGDDLMVRTGPDQYQDALARSHAREMDFTGRPMRGFVVVEAQGFQEDEGLEEWVARGVEYAESLPPKGK